MVPATDAKSAWRGDVARWLVSYMASITGDVVYFLALSWAATDIGGPGTAGAVLVTAALPRAALMLGGGVVADRFGALPVIIASDLTRAAAIGGAAIAFLLVPSVPVLIALALVFGVVDALFMPSIGALPPRIAPAGQLGRVQGLRTLAIRLSNSIGPPLAGVMLAAGGASSAFGFACGLFVVSLGFLMFVRVRPLPEEAVPHRATPWQDLTDGLRHLRRVRVLRTLVVVIALSELFFTGPFTVGVVLLSAERGWGTWGMGLVASAFSVGGGMSAGLLAIAGRVPRAGLMISICLLASASATTWLGEEAALGPAVALSATTGFAGGLAGMVAHTVVQLRTDPAYLGRVTAVITLCTLGLSPVLFPLTGLFATWWGAGSVFRACAAVCALAGVVAAASPALRRAGVRSADRTR